MPTTETRPRAQPPSAQVLKTTVETTRALLDRSKSQLQLALPKHMSVDRLIRIAMTSIQRTPRLGECTPLSLLGAVMQCAQLGLEPDGVTSMAFLVPYWNSKKGAYECQFQVGYRGLMDLAYRSEHVIKFDAHPVYARDHFDYEYGIQPSLAHKPHRGENRGELVAAYAVAFVRDAVEPLFRVVERHDIEKARARSKSANDGPWVTDYEAMAMKTALRRLAKLVRQTPELRRAVALDELAEHDLPQGLELLTGDVLDAEVVTEAQRPDVVHQKAADDTSASATISDAQQKRLLALMKGRHSQEEFLTWLQEQYRIETVPQILKSDFDAILQWATH